MPIDRYQIRNVYSLADPDLYKEADKNDPEALLEGVAMAGLVGVIRQLGDLAEFAAEIFHGLHEEVTATAARGHGLLVRAQQLELEIPSTERSFMSQKNHATFFSNSGVDWHPKQKTTHNLITTGDMPRFVMHPYEDCRGPPRLFLLDKFDVGGAGTCLKRYTDPSFYKVEVSSYEIENAEAQRDRKMRKSKKKGSPWKGGGAPEISPNSKAKLHQLFLEDRIQNAKTEPTHRVKLKRRPNKLPFDSKTGESYFNKLLSPQSEGKMVHQALFHPSIIPVPSDSPNQSGREKFMDAMGSPFNLGPQIQSPSLSSSLEKKTSCRNLADSLAGKVNSPEVDEKKVVVDEEIKTDGVQNGYGSDDVASEMDNYVDALSTMESELETRVESRGMIDPIIDEGTYSDQFSDSQMRGPTEIPFCPRVPPEMNQGVNLEEGSEEEVKKEEHEIDIISPAGSLLSFQISGNNEGEVENVHHPNKEGSSPRIHLPNILEINEDNHSTRHSGISRVDDFSVSLVEHDCVVKESLDTCEICCLPEEQLKEIGGGGDYVLHISDSPEAKVSDLDGADKCGDVKERDRGLVKSEIEVGSSPGSVCVPDRNDDNALSTHTELKGKGEEEMEKTAAGVVPLDVEKNVDNSSHSTSVEEADESLELSSIIQEDSATYEDNTSRKPSLDSTSDQIHSLLDEKNQIKQQAAVSHDLGNHTEIASGSHVDNQTDLNTHSEPLTVNPASQSLLHEEDMTVSVDIPPTLELLQTNGDPIDQVKHQFHSDPCSVNLATQSQEVPPMSVSISESEKLLTSHGADLFDQVKPQFHHSIKLASQSEEDPQGKSTTVSVKVKPPSLTSHDIHPFDQVKQQFHSDPYLVNYASQIPLPETPPTPKAIIHDIDQVKRQLPPVFPGFSIPPVKVQDPPPLPPLPPMQWRMRKLHNPSLTPSDAGQHNFPPFFQSKPNDIKNPETPENQEFKHDPSLPKQDDDKSEANLVPQQISNVYLVSQGDDVSTNIRSMKIQRPRNPLIDALATHDKSKMRKVSDRAMSQITKGHENDKLLEQIRTKSYKLKPLVQTRPNIHGPTTNVRIAAILEKANAIRQAFAGSDDDDDSDSWSDS